ncbi:MAG TPA: aspartate/tyrosine/aromatic aminotransferase [Candidatus Avipropionibacterium avicola]|uniref:Aminotransferase n=1 Tax=Candidatus Avipropionibacterium avicola TaxID=2840701 RepID=A0A9D1KM55_9ACTN|nr:aspartate/tyrosine/aromatic aminotransferase [Candidatus Avipropionibacterium avicola]
MSLLSSVERAPRDPILGLTEAFQADDRQTKVNLGVGVYMDESGKVPLLKCVQQAQQQLAQGRAPYGYLPIDGLKAYDDLVAGLVLDDPVTGAAAAPRDRVAVVQGLGGTGSLKIAGDFLRAVSPNAKLLISTPSWENHNALFSRAGFDVQQYPYYDATGHRVDVDAMVAALGEAEAGTVVVLHACCHNPTGYDLGEQDWARVEQVVRERGLVPLLDMAYQGFATGLAEDGAAVRRFAASGPVFVTTSFSKTFSLYGERIGALAVVCDDADEAARVLSQLKIIVRTTYSNPPTNGASIVATVLADDQLRVLWESELGEMRDRIKQMRTALVDGLKQARPDVDASHITDQNGMFSYSGLSKEQMVRLREDFALYGLDSGRLAIPALNPGNIDRVVDGLAQVW